MSSGLLMRLLREDTSAEWVGAFLRPASGRPRDMEQLLEQARRHGVLGRVWQRWGEHIAAAVAPCVAGRWRREARRLAARNLASREELARIAGVLRHAGIRALPFKGPALAAVLRASPCSREYTDVDVLIDGADSARALGVLRTEGYGERMPAAAGAASDQVALAHPQGSMILELQWDLGRRWHLHAENGEAPFAFRDLWRRRADVSLCGETLSTLAAEDLFLMLAAHGARHGWSRMMWVCDAADAIARWPGMDWELVFRRAARLGCVRRAGLALQLCADVLGARIPTMARESAGRGGGVARIARVLIHRWDEADPPEWLSDLRDAGFALAILDTWRERARVGIGMAGERLRPNARDRACVDLPAWAAPAYCAVRPVRLAWRYGREAVAAAVRAVHPREEESSGFGTRF